MSFIGPCRFSSRFLGDQQLVELEPRFEALAKKLVGGKQ
jgi:hypothetical protein